MDSENIEEQQAIAGLEADDLGSGERRALLEIIRRVGTDRSIGILRTSLRSTDTRIQVRAVFALAGIGTARAIEALLDCLEMGTGPRFTFAVKSLAELNGPGEVVPALIQTLEKHRVQLSEGDKQLIIFALAQTPHRSEVPVLSTVIRDGNRRTRRMAAMTLILIRAPESREALEEAVESLSWLRGLEVRRVLRSQRNSISE
jgi:HEAT repeat protein